MKKYLKWGLIILVLVLIIGAVFGEDENNGENQSINIEYNQVGQRDVSYGDVKRYALKVVVHEQVSTEELKAISKEIIEEEKEYSDFNAMSINFYDYEELTSGIYQVPPLGIVEYAPNGEWSEAHTVETGDYSSMEYSWELKEKNWDNQLTEKELEIYSYMQQEYENGVDMREKIYQNVSNKHDISIEKVKEVDNKIMDWVFE